METAFDTARDLGAAMIISGCGSRHVTQFYGPHPDNHRPETRDRLIRGLRRVVPFAEATGVVLALECHVTTALDTPEHIREILDAVDSRWVRANFDPVNLLGSFGAVWHNGQAMRHMWDVLGACYTPSAHIKDVVAGPDLVVHISEAAPGHGMLDLDVFFEICAQLGDDASVIVEISRPTRRARRSRTSRTPPRNAASPSVDRVDLGRDADHRRQAAVHVLVGRGPGGHADAHRRTSVPARATAPAGAVALDCLRSPRAWRVRRRTTPAPGSARRR